MAEPRRSPLQALDAARHDYTLGPAAVERTLAAIRVSPSLDDASLIHLHDAALFLRAFPHSAKVARAADHVLAETAKEVRRRQTAGADMDAYDSEEVSGIAGTVHRNSWTFEAARWLLSRYPREIETDWNLDEQARPMSMILPPVLPLLEDDSYVEPDTPYLRMMQNAAGRAAVLPWLLESFQKLPLSLFSRTGLYDALNIELQWRINDGVSRTFSRRPARRLFLHREPLLERRQVSLQAELSSPDLPLRRLPQREANEIVDFARATLAVRYRELHGTTHGDPSWAYEADCGRGVKMYIFGCDPAWRLPLRAYFAGCTVKNGVAVNYFEAIGLFEWMEVGFNTFYAFRSGETAWIYAKLIHLLRQIAGATCISVYPYQIGQHNDEAIASGAFWFYRKLGFRPGRPDLLALTEKEESRMAREAGHRTSARVLRKLADGHVFYESGDRRPGDWDTFSTRNILLAVQDAMAKDFHGDAEAMRQVATKQLGRMLRVSPGRWSGLEQHAFSDFACVLQLVPGVAKWTPAQKRLLTEIIRAKATRPEREYLWLMQRHEPLRQAFLKIGSKPRR